MLVFIGNLVFLVGKSEKLETEIKVEDKLTGHPVYILCHYHRRNCLFKKCSMGTLFQKGPKANISKLQNQKFRIGIQILSE